MSCCRHEAHCRPGEHCWPQDSRAPRTTPGRAVITEFCRHCQASRTITITTELS